MLCYNPSQGSSGISFHLDCFYESKQLGICTSLHMRNIWIFSLWARPWKTAPCLDEFEASHCVSYEPTQDESKSVNNFWREFGNLPLEVNQEIIKMTYGSIFWKVFAARNWRDRLSSRLADDKVTTLPISHIKGWKRSEELRKLLNPIGNILNITIDNLGIQSLEVSDCWPSVGTIPAKKDKIYIVENIANLQRLVLEKKVFLYTICLFARLIVYQGSYCRIQNIKKPFRLWDTPTPPPFSSCQFRDKDISPSRLKTIELNTSLRGLSVFYYNGFTYGIYPHYTDELEPSSVLDILNQFPSKRRKSLIWFFCSLDQQQIQDVWLRHDSGNVRDPVLVVFYSDILI